MPEIAYVLTNESMEDLVKIGRTTTEVKQRIRELDPLFAELSEPEDIESGTIYVLRSQSTYPFVTENSELIHKIGVTGEKVETRISGVEKDSTFLLASVDVIATNKLHNINRIKMENLFHQRNGGFD